MRHSRWITTGLGDLTPFRTCHTLDLSHTCVMDASALGNVYEFRLKHTPVEDISMLGNVHTIYHIRVSSTVRHSVVCMRLSSTDSCYKTSRRYPVSMLWPIVPGAGDYFGEQPESYYTDGWYTFNPSD